ncbi:MAG: DNA topoisomerase IV subunit A, partial [Mesorhizobium amorphae]
MSEESGVADEVLEDVSRAVSSRYLDYAVATIMHRAIPDARDGLKPVHRRIINAMRELKLSPTGAFRKSAKIAGDVMGNYHPHGDSAIYDAMVRMAQPFSMRYPLVDGQGNFGNVDGDSAAASRYTEARMEARTEEMLDGVTENAVDFRPNYDGTRSEPTVLPAAFPNLLVNGASGIAVGMATNVPPHNLTETLNAAIAMIADQESDPLSVIRAPDFPTGGVIAESEETIRAVMSSGKGALRLRSAWEVEEDASGRRVVVTEIPYQVRKSALIERLALLIEEKRLPALADVRDESDENVRIVLEPRSRSVDPAEMMEALFSMSDLEVRFQVNMTALEDGVTPRVCGARRLLEIWIRHRVDVVRRVSENRLAKALTRAAMVDAVLKAIGALDAVIAIVRGSDDPETEIMALLGITREQAETVLGIRLRSLRKLDERVLLNERDELARRAAELRGILSGEATLLAEVGRQAMILRDAAVAAGDARRTVVSGEPAARVSAGEIRAMSVTREPITVDVSAGGWVRAARGHVD